MKELLENGVDKSPFTQFSIWFNEMLKTEVIEPSAMILATASAEGRPSARTVLLKQFNDKGFTFYTNYKSKKAKDLLENPYAEALFLWLHLERQVRIFGKVEKVSDKESEGYFHLRPAKSQISAWASEQSSVIPNRNYLEEKYSEYLEKFKEGEVPLPPFWGGFRIIPEKFEFWQGRESRLHDRLVYRKKNEKWEIVRLSP